MVPVGPVVLYRHRQRLPLPHQHDKLLSTRDARIDEIALQKHVGKGA